MTSLSPVTPDGIELGDYISILKAVVARSQDLHSFIFKLALLLNYFLKVDTQIVHNHLHCRSASTGDTHARVSRSATHV